MRTPLEWPVMLLALACFLIVSGVCLVVAGLVGGALHRNTLHSMAKL